jgi:cyclopropane fatty-acyl-phospholipid synthase-like methyltransferase
MNNRIDKDKETFATWNKIASLYEDMFMGLNIYDESYDAIVSRIPKMKASLLEVGCGPGNIAKYLLSKRPDFKLFGIDVATNMIELARKNNPTARFEVMDTRAISTLKETFDGLIAGFCLPYLSPEEAEDFIETSSDMLNEGGLIYLSFVAGTNDESGFKVGSSGDRVYFYYHESEKLKELLVKNKFTDLQWLKVQFRRNENQSEEHTIVIARKSEAS